MNTDPNISHFKHYSTFYFRVCINFTSFRRSTSICRM